MIWGFTEFRTNKKMKIWLFYWTFFKGWC